LPSLVCLPIVDRYHLAIACQKAGDRAGYRAASARIAGRMPPAGTPLELGEAVPAVMAFIVGPGVTDEWSIPLSWDDRVLAGVWQRFATKWAIVECHVDRHKSNLGSKLRQKTRAVSKRVYI
jgi:hypothetical protein